MTAPLRMIYAAPRRPYGHVNDVFLAFVKNFYSDANLIVSGNNRCLSFHVNVLGHHFAPTAKNAKTK